MAHENQMFWLSVALGFFCLFFLFFVFLFFWVFFWLCTQHVEVPEPGIKLVPQQQPKLLQ